LIEREGKKMQKRRLGNTELQLTTVGFGAWAMGGGGWEFAWGQQDDRDSAAAIIRALEIGVNWIDTAAAYGLGHSEEVIGKVLKEVKERPIIATKCGINWDSSGKITRWVDAKQVHREIEASLKRLGVDAIDLYQVHWPFPDDRIEEVWDAMADVVKQGKARYIGVSNYTVAQIKRILPIHEVASVQPRYSMIHRDIEDDLLPFCDEHRIGVVCYSPMGKGILTGKMTKERVNAMAPDDHRRNDPDFQEPRIDAHLQLVESLRPIAEAQGRSLAQLAIAWVLRRNEVTAAIAGARRPEQIEDTAKASDWRLSPHEIEKVGELLEKHEGIAAV
jgi:aryl-alcohol dehydrogenase-like predicted oxidoreductase